MNHPLLQKASMVLNPTAYSSGKLHSIKPAQYLGSETIADPNFDTDSTGAWSIATTSGTPRATKSYISDGKFMRLTYDVANGAALYKGSVFTVGFKYKISFIAKGTANSKFASVGDNATVGDAILNPTLSTDWQRYEFEIKPTGTLMRLYLATASVGNTLDIDEISVKTLNNADFDFDRNSTGTRVNENNLIEDVPYNLLRYTEAISTDFGVTDVTLTDNYGLSPSGTQTSTRAQLTNLGQSRAFNTVTSSVVSGQSYTFSCHYKGTQGQTVYINALPVGGTEVSKAITLNGGWQRESVTFTAGSSSNYVYFVDSRKGGTATDFEVWGAQMVKGDQPKDYLKTTDRLDIPRIDFTSGVGTILLEPSRTNLSTNSEAFDSWTNGSTYVTASQAVSPDGNTTADQLAKTSSFQQIQNTATVVSGSRYSFSVFVKENTLDRITLRLASGSNDVRKCLDLSDLSVVDAGGNGTGFIETKVEEYPNGWYRYTVIATTDGTSLFMNIYAGKADVVESGNIYIWGSQLEAGSYATSYIPTSGSTVTRSADSSYSHDIDNNVFNSSAFTLYLDSNVFNDTTNNFLELVILYNDSNPSTTNLRFESRTNNQVHVQVSTVVSSGDNFNSASFGGSSINFNKFAITCTTSQVKIYADGSLINTYNGTYAYNFQKIGFRNNDGEVETIINHKTVALFKEALTEAEAITLTS